MQALIHEVAEKAKSLPDTDKLTLVDDLLSQLDRPDPDIDKVWANEARKRWRAYREGRVATVSYADVMSKYIRS